VHLCMWLCMRAFSHVHMSARTHDVHSCFTVKACTSMAVCSNKGMRTYIHTCMGTQRVHLLLRGRTRSQLSGSQHCTRYPRRTPSHTTLQTWPPCCRGPQCSSGSILQMSAVSRCVSRVSVCVCLSEGLRV
jgi:hypothetical protein